MKVSKIFLRWYKSFHLNYRGSEDKGELSQTKPWEDLKLTYCPSGDFPFIEVPVESDITTIVGANESGKSHILNALSKVLTSQGTTRNDFFQQTDLCHYASIRNHNIGAWPNIGLEFLTTVPSDIAELRRLLPAIFPGSDAQPLRFQLFLIPDGNTEHGVIFSTLSNAPTRLTLEQLTAVRSLLPKVQFLDSQAILASEVN